MSVKENISSLRQEIKVLCQRMNRELSEVTLLAVTKGVDIGLIKEAIFNGITDIGENKVQEAVIQCNAIHNTQYAGRIKWHMIGHLQTNKARDAVKIFDLIHSVDSLRLAKAIDKEAGKIDKIQDILLEVNASGEKTKFGLKPDEAIEVIKKASEFKNIHIKGLMTMAPLSSNPENSRFYFRSLRELSEKINTIRNTHDALRILSMGMSQDYQVAIEEGATIVRIGRAIFKNAD